MRFMTVLLAIVLVFATLCGCAVKNNGDTPIVENGEVNLIGTDEAKKIALENAAVSEAETKGLEVELDREGQYPVYEVCFDTDGYEYEYDVDAETGEIVRVFREADDPEKLPTPTLSDQTPSSHHEEEEEHHDEAVTEHHEEAVTEHHEEEHHEDEHHEAVTTAAPVAEPAAPASDGYIGREAARDIALAHAGVSQSEVYDLEYELDRERGVVVYDVSFDVGGYDYDYEIDAASGEILRSDKERDSDYRATTVQQPAAQDNTQQSSGDIGSDKAQKIALDHAGYTADEVYALKSERDYENGRDIYDVSFEVEGYDFDYDIDRATGDIIKNKKEPDNDAPKGKRTDDSTDYITADKAKETALNHAGFKAADVTRLEAELDFDHGSARYEVSFKNGGYEYEYEIDAVSGEILHSEKERD